MSTDELLAEALRLPRRERARVAQELLSSLEEPAEDVAAAWAAELDPRSREVAEGRVRTVLWETVRTEIVRELDSGVRVDLPEARAELRSAALWYDARNSKLGDEFVAAVTWRSSESARLPNPFQCGPEPGEPLR